MKTDTAKHLLTLLEEEINTELRNLKVCLVEDIIKAQRLAFGFGALKYNLVITAPDRVFDIMWELGIDELEAYQRALGSELSHMAWALTGGPTNEEPKH